MSTKQRILIRLFIIALSALTLIAHSDSPPLLNSIHTITLPQQTQIIFDISKNFNYKTFTLENPHRIVIDLPEVKLNTKLHKILIDPPILHIRFGHPNPTILRVVLDLNKNLYPSATQQKNKGQERLIVELNEHPFMTKKKPVESNTQTTLTATNTIESNQASKMLPKDNDTESNNLMQPVITTIPMKGTRLINVIIDPGHGGKDPGTTGTFGTREKDVVLAISTYLYRILAKEPGFRPILTRSGDYFIPLRGRLAITRKNRGDIFIAIHADAYKDSYATGAAVFALSAHGASSEAARWLAEKENYSELGGINLSDKSDMLRSVLIDLSQTATISASLQLGSSLLRQLSHVGNLHYRTVEQAPFMVLKSPDVPSVLVETGFLSNAQEQARLRNPIDQQQIANALAKGIIAYFKNNSPPGTLLATLNNQKDRDN